MILVLDDEPNIAAALRGALTNAGFRVRTAGTCDEAFAILGVDKPRLILSDINMPCRSGLEFVTELKKSEATRNIPVIFISAMSRPEDIQAGFDAGGADYIVKPFDCAHLLRTVRAEWGKTLEATHPRPSHVETTGNVPSGNGVPSGSGL